MIKISAMKIIASLKLQPTEEQKQALLETIERINEACNYISEVAWQNKRFGRWSLHKLCYYDVKERFDLTAQAVIHAIGKVANAYKLGRKTKRHFKKRGAIPFDDRILRYKQNSTVSIWTVRSRQRIPYVCGKRQRELLKSRQGESDLIYQDGQFFLNATCNVEEPPPYDPQGFLGVDLGVKNIAALSDGEIFSGAKVNGLRKRHRKLRARLQSKGTKSARRLLKKRSKKEHRFVTDTNHCIAKRIVAKAKAASFGIALENLKGIRKRITVSRRQRATFSSWAFYQLQQFILYKAKLSGVPVVFVDPKNTSHTCTICGFVDKRNRPSQASFSCFNCGFALAADIVAASVIAGRAAVNQPNVASSAA
jgi:IS605 OrfB family transposase